ncbi:MAG TPA: ATP phosphoribosyltransferase [Acidimicrobiia bacterium]|nr:ATP phosphoribosyltransferase [Acidimicrobiia bacterium]
MTPTLNVAVPNKGRLRTPTIDLLAAAGLSFEAGDRALSVSVDNADIDLLFVRTEDIGELVEDGVADIGITGVDLLAEAESELEVLLSLGYGRCRLAAAVPNGSDLVKVEDFAGRRVATSHPTVTGRYFNDAGIEVTVVPLRGSVEVATKLGVAEGIVDLVSTGSTLRVNGLREVGTLLESEAVLVTGGRGNGAVERLTTAIGSVVAARRKRYLLLNAPAGSVDRIAALIPGLSAPTVMPLAGGEMCAIHSVVDANDVWHLLPGLEQAGGRGILVLPIEQLVP